MPVSRTPTTTDHPRWDHIGPTMSRRGFLATSAVTTAGAVAAGAVTATLGARAVSATPVAPGQGDVIVVVFLRGGNDGLSMVAPYQMPSYRTLRPTIRVKGPDEFDDPTGKAGLPLVAGGNVAPFEHSGTFAFHPAMASLHAGAWSEGHLAVVHAVGMPAGESDTRSHFDAMRNWECGSANMATSTGLLNRYLAGQGALAGLPAIGRGRGLQRILTGPVPAFSIESNARFSVSGFGRAADNNRARAAITAWYDPGTADLLTQTGANTMSAVARVAGIDWNAAPYQPQRGAAYGWDDTAQQLKQVAQLIRADLGVRCVAVDVDGFDTHEGMGLPEDPTQWYRRLLASLSDALSAFATDLGPAMDEVTVFTMSEFGRTINENGTAGTDHGRASAMLAMGNKIRGGVYGSFVPEIADGPEGDLAVLTDVRRPISEILGVRGGAANLDAVFPGYAQQAPLGFCLA